MTITAILGGGNAEYLAFDNTLRLLTVNFSSAGSLSTFNSKVGTHFKEVEGPKGAAHPTYHTLVQDAYFTQLGVPRTYDTYRKHSHFQYGNADQLREQLMFLCQSRFGYPCILVNPAKPAFLELVNRVEVATPPVIHARAEAQDSSPSSFASPSTAHRFAAHLRD